MSQNTGMGYKTALHPPTPNHRTIGVGAKPQPPPEEGIILSAPVKQDVIDYLKMMQQKRFLISYQLELANELNIAAKGGGTVDGYPIATRGKPYSSSFLWGGTESMFAELGFHTLGHLGTSKLVMRENVRSR